MSNNIRTGWEQAAKAIAERGQAWSKRGDYALAMECSQLVSMLHDLKPVAAPVASAAPSGELPPLPELPCHAVLYTQNGYRRAAVTPRACDALVLRETAIEAMQASARAAIAHQPPKEALKSALQRYNEHMEGCDEPSAIDRLRFFASLSMTNGTDWVDSEKFFDDVIAATEPNKQLVEALQNILNTWPNETKQPYWAARWAKALDDGRAALASAGVEVAK